MKKVSDYRSDSSGVLDNAKQATIAGATAVQERVKDTVQTGLARAQEGISAGLDTTQDALKSMQKGSRKYSRNLKKMQKSAGKKMAILQKGAKKNLKDLQQSAGSNMQSLQKGAKKNLKSLQQGAGSNMQAAQKNVQQVGNALQSKRAKAVRRRWRNKWVFRVALATGVAIGLLFAPRSGSEMRLQLGSFWQRLTRGRAAITPTHEAVTEKPDMASANRR